MNFHQSPVSYFSHVNLNVSNLEQSLYFYQNALGLSALSQDKTSAVLSANGKDALLTLIQPEDVQPKKGRTTGLYHFALLIPERKELANLLQHLLLIKTPLQGASDHHVSEAIYLSDPDGNGIELYYDRPKESWEWNKDSVHMTTEALDAEDLLSLATDDSWDGAPSGMILGHMHLHVASIADSERFYMEGLGLNMTTRYGAQAAFLSDGDYHHHLGINTWAGENAPPPEKNQVGMKNMTFTVPSQETIEEIVFRLKRIGAPLEISNKQLITEDPSENQIIVEVEKPS